MAAARAMVFTLLVNDSITNGPVPFHAIGPIIAVVEAEVVPVYDSDAAVHALRVRDGAVGIHRHLDASPFEVRDAVDAFIERDPRGFDSLSINCASVLSGARSSCITAFPFAAISSRSTADAA